MHPAIALAATVAQVFPAVYVIDEPGPEDNLGNSMLYATMQPIPAEQIIAQAASLSSTLPAEFHSFASEAMTRLNTVKSTPDTLIFTDDRAPVEMVIHRIIFDFLARGEDATTIEWTQLVGVAQRVAGAGKVGADRADSGSVQAQQ